MPLKYNYSHFCFSFCVSWNMSLPCKTGWHGIHNVVQAGLELTSALLSLSLECWDFICVSQCLGQYSWIFWNSGNNAVSPDEHLSLGKRWCEPATPESRQFHAPLTILSTQQSQVCWLLFAAGDRDVRNTALSRMKDSSGKEILKPEALPISVCPASSLQNPHPFESLSSSCTKKQVSKKKPFQRSRLHADTKPTGHQDYGPVIIEAHTVNYRFSIYQEVRWGSF